MEVKTSTKEKYHVIGVLTPHLAANMTEELLSSLQQYAHSSIPNVVLSLKTVQVMDEESGEALVKTQQYFYENAASFVICEMTPEIENFLDSKDLLELMNVTPTESEAADIVQMEEIERELLDENED